MKEAAAPPRVYSAPAALRALDIMECLVAAEAPLTTTEISRQLRLPKSSVFGLLHTLRNRGYIDRDHADRYALTLKLCGLAGSMLAALDVHQKAGPVLRTLVRESELSGYLAALCREEAVYIDTAETPGATGLPAHVGCRVDLSASAVGKALLAWLPESEVDCILRARGPAAAIKAELARVRESGYAARDEGDDSGVRAIAAPIFNGRGSVVAAIGLRGARLQVRKKDIPLLAERVVKAAQAISRSLGASECPS